MSEHEKKQHGWQNLADSLAAKSESKDSPAEVSVRLTHGVWFGTAMGIGFAIGFLISFMILLGAAAFIIYSRFPGLFG